MNDEKRDNEDRPLHDLSSLPLSKALTRA